MGNRKFADYKTIEQYMLDELNQQLDSMGCALRLKFCYDDPDFDDCIMAPKSELFIDSFILNPTEEFCNYLIRFFSHHGVKVNFNNTRTIIWARK